MTREKMQVYLALHHHRHGVDGYVLRCKTMPTTEEIIAHLDDDYEPDRDESIEVLPCTVIDFDQIRPTSRGTHKEGTTQ